MTENQGAFKFNDVKFANFKVVGGKAVWAVPRESRGCGRTCRAAADPAKLRDKRYLSTNELSDYLGISKWSLYKLVQRRSIPFIPIVIEGSGKGAGKNLVRFDILEIDKWMKKRAVTPLRLN